MNFKNISNIALLIISLILFLKFFEGIVLTCIFLILQAIFLNIAYLIERDLKYNIEAIKVFNRAMNLFFFPIELYKRLEGKG